MIPIIIQTYNRIQYTMNVISAINNNILYPYHLIIIDNGSNDGTQEYLKFCKKNDIIQELVLNEKNLGIAIPKNQGIEIVHNLARETLVKYVCITDNDIIPPFVRSNDGDCILGVIAKNMDNHSEIGMCGVDLDESNAPEYQEWWWRLRQHPLNIPEFTEIAIGFWFSVTRYEYLKEYKFSCDSLYGRTDEAFRNWLTLEKKKKIGLIKGISRRDKTGKHIETIPKVGIHLGWREDVKKFPDYFIMKKQERAKVEKIWDQTNKKF